MKFLKSKYELLGFEVSANRTKKYDALIKNKRTGEIERIGFGARVPLMEHYKDQTGLKVYSRLDHNDLKRRSAFKMRFAYQYDPRYYSPLFFSWNYLW